MFGLLTHHASVVDNDHVKRSGDGFLPWCNDWTSIFTTSHRVLSSSCFQIEKLKQFRVRRNGLTVTAKFLPFVHCGLVEFKLSGCCDKPIEAIVIHGFEFMYMLVDRIVQTS